MKVKLETDGGFTGRGMGSLVVDGTKVTASDGRRSVEGTLTDGEEASIRAAIPENWPESTGKGWPDQIRYSLTIDGKKASWYGEGGTFDEIHEVLWKIRDRVLRS